LITTDSLVFYHFLLFSFFKLNIFHSETYIFFFKKVLGFLVLWTIVKHPLYGWLLNSCLIVWLVFPLALTLFGTRERQLVKWLKLDVLNLPSFVRTSTRFPFFMTLLLFSA
jgi:hypothetical protein